MNLIKAGMFVTLIVAMSLIGWAAKWSIDNIGLWIVGPALALIFWIARQIDKSDARKANGHPPRRSLPPGSRDQ